MQALDEGDYRDDVLRLLFICCHPDLPATQQIALALRIVSGLSVKQIARAFLVGESAMEQRITRAKAKVAGARVAFETPSPADRSERVAAVAAMLYLVFNEGYSAGYEEQSARAPLCDEAIRLGRLLLRLFPAEPELMGLLALMLLQHARLPARFDSEGAIVLLEDQDRSRWDRKAIQEGLALIDKAIRHRSRGPYQVQAAISALHAEAATPDATDWRQIAALYGALAVMMPSPVVEVNRAVAVAMAQNPMVGLILLHRIKGVEDFYPYHAARADLLRRTNQREAAADGYERAIELCQNSAERAYLQRRLDELTQSLGGYQSSGNI